jgi:hypothetical protein
MPGRASNPFRPDRIPNLKGRRTMSSVSFLWRSR